jgi:hypothetical protein
MESDVSHMLIAAVETAFDVSQGSPDPKQAFIDSLTSAVEELKGKKLLSDEEYRDVMNSREQIYHAAVQQVMSPEPATPLRGLRTSVQMFGPQFVISDELRAQIIHDLGAYPVWAVVSTFAADTMYSGLTFPEAMHRAQVEALEVGREASVVLQLHHFQGPSLTGG